MSSTEQDRHIRDLAGILAKALQTQGIISVNLSYTGANDSTDGCSIDEVLPAEKSTALELLEVTFTAHEQDYSQPYLTGTFNRPLKSVERTSSFEDGLYELAERLWVRAGQGGWYNNEGGGGYVTIDHAGNIEFHHYNYIQTEETAAHWRANIFVGDIDTPIEETEVEEQSEAP